MHNFRVTTHNPRAGFAQNSDSSSVALHILPLRGKGALSITSLLSFTNYLFK